MCFKQAEETIIDLVRQMPDLILTGSRYFGNAKTFSDWDFILPTSKENTIPAGFRIIGSPWYSDDPFLVTVYESFGYGVAIHIQIVKDEDIPLRIKAMEIIRETGALNGVQKDGQAPIWRAVMRALAAGLEKVSPAPIQDVWVNFNTSNSCYYVSLTAPNSNPITGAKYMDHVGFLVEAGPAYFNSYEQAADAATKYKYNVVADGTLGAPPAPDGAAGETVDWLAWHRKESRLTGYGYK